MSPPATVSIPTSLAEPLLIPDFESRLLQGNDGKAIHVQEWAGAAEPSAGACVLIHGTGEGAHVWDCFAATFATLFNRVIAIDLRGHGDSPWREDKTYRLDAYLQDTLRALMLLGLRSVSLIGHSAGAAIALRIAATEQMSVRRLVLVDYGPEMSRAAREHAQALFLGQFRAYQSPLDYATHLQTQQPLASPTLIKYVAERALRRQSDGRYTLKCDPAVGSWLDPQLDDEAALNRSLMRVRCPILLMRGVGSAMLSRQVASRICRLHQRAQVVTIENAGHAVMIDNPEAFSRAIHNFCTVDTR